MFSTRLVIFSLLILVLFSGSALAQRSGPEFRRPLSCEPLEPRTRMEALEARYGKVLIKGFTRVANLDVRDGDVRVDAVELREAGNSNRATGIVIALKEAAERPREDRAFVDYEELDALLNGLDSVGRANETVTKLTGFEARYRTNGDLEINVFRQTRSGTAVALSTGICDKVIVSMTLDELGKLRGMIVEAKAKLDEIK